MKRKPPHIKVDAFALVDSHFSGVGHYTLGIVRGFDELAEQGKLTYSLIVPRGTSQRLKQYGLKHYKRILRNPVPNRVIRGFMKYHIRFPMDLVLGVGNYYFPSFLAWPTWFSKSTVVVHDVTYLAVPECVEEGNRDYLARTVPFSLKNAHTVVCVSDFSKSEIIKYYDYPASKIYVAKPSIDRRLFYRRSEDEMRRVRLKYDIYDENYILSVGNIEPRKNYLKLVEAYMSLPVSVTRKYPLVIIGAGGWNNEAIKQKIQEAKEMGLKIINPGRFVADEDMPALYSGAQFFAFVPIYEGFGMSPLESFASGTPVLASRVASVPEAAGEAAVYCNPQSVKDIRKHLEYMVAQTEKDRSQWNEAIEAHLQASSWIDSAQETAAALTGLSRTYFQQSGDSK